MRDTMRARGPDAAGTHLDRHAGLGHRRLSIIDLEASTQPMLSDDGRICITYNGEIYNFPELRRSLIARGHKFRTDGDTEVILRLYEQFGDDCVTHLRGMFAFAIWDARTDRLLLARDRMGVKPLYYTVTKEAFLFGSELKALLADQTFSSERRIDLSAIHSYLAFLCVPDPASIYEHVHKLPAGHTLVFQKGTITLRRYWDVTFEERDQFSEREWCEQLLEQLQESVRIRLLSDVPLGAFLSGGIDSSAVVAMMAATMNQPVKTFSIGFAESRYNEASDASLVARHLGTDHTELILEPAETQAVIPKIFAYFDEPFADSSAIPTYCVSALARRQVTVALSGDGGDELFGGYPWRQIRPAYQRAMVRLPLPLRHVISKASQGLPAGIPGSNFLKHLHWPYGRYILDAMAVFREQERDALYSSDTRRALSGSDAYGNSLPHLRDSSSSPWASRMMEYDLKTYLPNDILTKVDRMSMLNSLEAREPLLDHRLVELAARIPVSLKVRGRISKYILKKTIAPFLPASIMTKPKQGFSIPLETWLRGDLREDVLDTIRGGNREGLFDPAAIDRVVDDFFRGDTRRNHQVWSLYSLEKWHQLVHSRIHTTSRERM